jgi:hypothetical protein
MEVANRKPVADGFAGELEAVGVYENATHDKTGHDGHDGNEAAHVFGAQCEKRYEYRRKDRQEQREPG